MRLSGIPPMGTPHRRRMGFIAPPVVAGSPSAQLLNGLEGSALCPSEKPCRRARAKGCHLTSVPQDVHGAALRSAVREAEIGHRHSPCVHGMPNAPRVTCAGCGPKLLQKPLTASG